jgi:signal transduction histidine kinase
VGVAVHVMDERPEEARAALVAIRAASRDALRDLRGILGLLRQTDDGEPRSPVAGLEQVPTLAENVRRAGVPVDLRLGLDGAPLPASVDLAAYRVIQEALTNVVRHAPGATATVVVRREGGELVVEVWDDGRAVTSGAESRQGAGHGLAGMRERVRAAGGALEAGPCAAGGFLVRATLPLEAGPA